MTKKAEKICLSQHKKQKALKNFRTKQLSENYCDHYQN